MPLKNHQPGLDRSAPWPEENSAWPRWQTKLSDGLLNLNV
jgi:hypothetical protein